VSEWKDVKSLRLAVEVLSPSTALFDRNKKRPTYQQYHVETVWLIDPQADTVEVWTPGDTAPAIATQTLQWHYDAECPSAAIDLARVFE
jgi:Uma2 family endonuclease